MSVAEKQSMAFMTWPSKLHPDWVMVHPCSHTTWAGVLSFPGGPSTHGEVVNFRELSFPVPKSRLEAALKLYVQESLKLTSELLLRVDARGTQGDYVVTYTPNAEEDMPVLRNPNWRDHLDLFQQAALDMADETERLRREYGPDGEHPNFDRLDWKSEASFDETQLGYWEWVVHRVQASQE